MSLTLTTDCESDDSFAAGDTWSATVGDSQHPATAWTLAFILRMGTNILSVAGVADGDNFDVAVTAAQSTALFPGIYARAYRFTEVGGDSRVETILGPPLRVLPNLTSATVGPRRTAYNAAVTAYDALSLSKISSFSSGGVSYTQASLGELQNRIDRLLIEALAEDRELGIGRRGGLQRIVTRM